MPSFTFKQLAAVEVSTAAIASLTLYTVPAGFRALVREFNVQASDAAATGNLEVLKGAVQHSLGGDVLTAAPTVVERRLMLEPGDVVRLNVTLAGGGGSVARVIVSGTEISTT